LGDALGAGAAADPEGGDLSGKEPPCIRMPLS